MNNSYSFAYQFPKVLSLNGAKLPLTNQI